MWGRVASDRSHLQTRGDGPQNSRPSHTPGSDPRNAQATSTNHSVTSSWAPTVCQAPAGQSRMQAHERHCASKVTF